MKDAAIALCRVSTPEQRENNSLNRQEESVYNAAKELDVTIQKTWSGNVSSKAGTNLKRKDLNEMYGYCKAHRNIKYLIVDEPDRFMRSIEEGLHWEVKFQEIGVKVYYASDDALNKGDLVSKLLKFSKYFSAEGSNLERQTKSINGHVKAIKEGRYTFPPKPGYIKSDLPGIHQSHPITFKILQKAFKDVASSVYTPSEALKELNDGEFRENYATWRMDKFRHYAIDPYYAGIVEKDAQVKARNENGAHVAMITFEEHERLKEIFASRLKKRGTKKQYNPEFPLNKLLLCEDCLCKFTGSMKNNGRKRKTTTYYAKYNCRGCGKSYHRTEVHQAIDEFLQNVTYSGAQQKELIEAMASVWQRKRSDKLLAIKNTEKEIERLRQTKSKLVIELASANTDIKPDLEEEIGRIKDKIDELQQALGNADALFDDLIDFLKFGLEYTNKLVEDWWQLDHETRVQCQELLFPGGITFNSRHKVGTTLISPIYTLARNKKDLRFSRKSLMVELVGTAPTSAGLPWFIVYRCRSFSKSRDPADK